MTTRSDANSFNPKQARDELRVIPLERICGSISSPRHDRNKHLEPLARSIQQRGLLHPILVRPITSSLFEVIAGERRFLAAKLAGLKDIEARVRTYPDPIKDNEPPGDVLALEDALLENLHRKRLSSLEVAEAVLELVCLRLGETPAFLLERLSTFESRVRHRKHLSLDDDDDRILEAFDSLGVMSWRAFVTRGLPLVRLPEDLKLLVRQSQINPHLAKKLARLGPIERQRKLEQIKRRPKQTRKLLQQDARVSSRLRRLQQSLKPRFDEPNIQAALELLEQELGLT